MTSYCTARKIAEFPIPFPMAQMISVILGFLWCSTVMVSASTVTVEWWAGVISFLVVAAFWGINYIAAELEMPFGDDPNDLPLCDMQRDMNASLLSLVHPKVLSVPKYDKTSPGTETTLLQVQSYVDSWDEERRLAWHRTRQDWLLLVRKNLLHFDQELGELKWEPLREEPHRLDDHIPLHFEHLRSIVGKKGVKKRKSRHHRHHNRKSGGHPTQNPNESLSTKGLSTSDPPDAVKASELLLKGGTNAQPATAGASPSGLDLPRDCDSPERGCASGRVDQDHTSSI